MTKHLLIKEKVKKAFITGIAGQDGSYLAEYLLKIGYEVHAITGKPQENEVLKKMGAKTIIDRNEFLQDPIKPLDKALYSSAVDTVGGDILAKTLTMVSNHGVVSCCGNVAGASFKSSVFPFILRGIQLCGIDSAESSIELKKELWDLLSDSWSLDLTNQTKIVDLSEIDKEIEKILQGNQIGRVVIKHGE